MAKVKSGVCQVVDLAKRESPLVRPLRRDNGAVPRLLSNLSAAQKRGMNEIKGGRSYRQHGISLSAKWKMWLREGGVWPAKCGEGQEVNPPDRIISGSVRVNLAALLVFQQGILSGVWHSTGCVLIGAGRSYRTQNLPTLDHIYSF